MLARWSRLKAESKKSDVALPVEIDQAIPAAQVAVMKARVGQALAWWEAAEGRSSRGRRQ